MSAIERIADLVPGPGLKSACLLAALEHGARTVDALEVARSWYHWLIDTETGSESREGVVAPEASAASAVTEDAAAESAPPGRPSSQAETATPIPETASAAPNQMRGQTGLESSPTPAPLPVPQAEAIADVVAELAAEEVDDAVSRSTAPSERETLCTATPATQATGPSLASAVLTWQGAPTNRSRIMEYLTERGTNGALVAQISASTRIKPTVLSVTLDKMKKDRLVAHIDRWWYAAGCVPKTPNPKPTKKQSKAIVKEIEPEPPPVPMASPDLLRERIIAFLDGQETMGAVEIGIARAVNCSVSTLGAELSRMVQAGIVSRVTMGLSSVWRLTKFNAAAKVTIENEPKASAIDKPARSVVPPIGNATRECKKCRRQFRPVLPTQERCNVCANGYSTMDLRAD